jgi:hypothetical protein
MNYGRVILGGLVAGLVLNVGEFLLNSVLIHNAMNAWAKAHNLSVDPGTTFMVVAVALTFILGIVMVWLYALIRPRLGAGPKTAIVAALIMWFGIYVYCGIIYGMILEQPTNLIILPLGWGILEYIAGAVAGAWLYKEA